MADVRRLAELGMVPELAKEVAAQIDGASGESIASVATVATANGTDAASTQALANALKARLNELIAALKQ